MLQFAQDDTAVELILTLSEKVSITTPYYLFVFLHVTTKDSVKFIKGIADDESGYQSRFNQFTINPAVLFLGKPVGEWHYTIYEQVSDSNTDVTLTGAVLENGKMMLGRATDFEFNKYNLVTTYKVYNG